MGLKLASSSGGSVELNAPVTASAYTLTVPAQSGTVALSISPNITVYTSGSGTYTVPTGARYLRVTMVGGGAGGWGGGTSQPGTAPTAGGNSTFGSSIAYGGSIAGVFNTNGGNGGSATISGVGTGIEVPGGQGLGSSYNAVSGNWPVGGQGGSSALGGAGGGGTSGTASGGAGRTNTGSGGGGGGKDGSTGNSGAGGGSGGYIDMIITTPSATYSYAVGAAGSGGSAGSSGGAGGAGGSGIVRVEAYF